MADHLGELFVALQRLIPQHSFSRLLGRVADSQSPALKNLLIRLAMKRYGISLDEAVIQHPEEYASFNAFFTRALHPDARPLDQQPGGILSPADGTISQLGPIQQGNLFQAKGHSFSTSSLLGLDKETCHRFQDGSFFTIYLSPRDYHRVHMPIAGKLIKTVYIPGRLFSVNGKTTEHVPGLFARNERLVCLFQTDIGLVAVVLVGALFVAGIETVWQKNYLPENLALQAFEPPPAFSSGEEIGRFKFGSTVIVTTEAPIHFSEKCLPSGRVSMGELMGIKKKEAEK